MDQHHSYKRVLVRDDRHLYMRDYNASMKIKKILARLSLVLLIILFSIGLLLQDTIGEELASIMIIAPVILMVVWFLVVWFYKGEPPPTFDPPIDIKAEYGKQFFEAPEVIEKEEALARISRLPKDESVDSSVVKIID